MSNDAKALAEKIATTLFTDYRGTLMSRLLMRSEDGQDMGSWYFKAARDQIERVLLAESGETT